MYPVTDTIAIDDAELIESFVRSSGPGGQNVNKVSSAVQLRFDVRGSPSLPNDVAVRLMRLAGKRLTKDGVIVIAGGAIAQADAPARVLAEPANDIVRSLVGIDAEGRHFALERPLLERETP